MLLWKIWILDINHYGVVHVKILLMISPKDYEYDLPPELIAQKPAVPRDNSRLFIYNTKTDEIIFDYFYNLVRYLPKNSFLVLNNTKVLPSRTTLKKETGGGVVMLFLVNEQMNEGSCRIIVDRKVKTGDKLYFSNGDYILITAQNEVLFTVQMSFPRTHLYRLLEADGTMPIPPYIKHSPLSRNQLKDSYQTIFADIQGSSAAPTASLHFTERVFRDLEAAQIPKIYTTLHVGMGTFAPVTEKNLAEKTLHHEWYEISKEALRCIDTSKYAGKELVAVGTTVVRTLESWKVKGQNSKVKTETQKSKSNRVMDSTNLFIMPPYRFQVIDHLITNFHIPGSSLMMLVEAFLQDRKAKRSLIQPYTIAIKEKFRFYSFGDVMLIL
ncbi:tRNA preQ1(34) S-adenosylmethionine ribosyltransferase-isomerase QueA [Candidatus Roizmanbacteria bacterium CG_4_10_14_0_8_um_filter_39_9]|uniref:tRNA preQ1(34) S-adenosylmethionine ribosyltransferase-isomerase QueA n=1 Tax=Candidatus Roizmanbacteria bacterium CG_4_10_14_0_8_um_filter_39_9 TaxID=1974829 RepID=A0A2M7QCN0_9BACT|nr:MAG: tRNA preQ1(34) S-adenosylmethionine ribosyltransferase-isomerase QueA [Candidatus Roizmanbacteria bacterium CG_4_10_14_0_8_um_filter_39_9]